MSSATEMQTAHTQSQGVRLCRQFNHTPLVKYCYMHNISGKVERRREGKREKMYLILTEILNLSLTPYSKSKYLFLESLFLLLLKSFSPSTALSR